ncbi:hypothetical protein LWI29_030847 [Acer saccharum]|uniref:Uncharacterized protein n=1 Tax=Acer saccharum TaxID=4024 RepID=A0AA39RIN7_ACESA|nr:hypothetical protein LWI29_030847 [Acer saccharum]
MANSKVGGKMPNDGERGEDAILVAIDSMRQKLNIRGMGRTRCPHSTTQALPLAPVEVPTEPRSRKGKDTVPRSLGRHPDYDQRLKTNKRRSMVIKRGLNFNDLAGTSFIAEVYRREWVTYCTIRNPCNVTVVHEFYVSMKSNEFLAGGSVRVKGKNVSFNAVHINERLETRSNPQWANRYESSGIYEMHN